MLIRHQPTHFDDDDRRPADQPPAPERISQYQHIAEDHSEQDLMTSRIIITTESPSTGCLMTRSAVPSSRLPSHLKPTSSGSASFGFLPAATSLHNYHRTTKPAHDTVSMKRAHEQYSKHDMSASDSRLRDRPARPQLPSGEVGREGILPPPAPKTDGDITDRAPIKAATLLLLSAYGTCRSCLQVRECRLLAPVRHRQCLALLVLLGLSTHGTCYL